MEWIYMSRNDIWVSSYTVRTAFVMQSVSWTSPGEAIAVYIVCGMIYIPYENAYEAGQLR